MIIQPRTAVNRRRFLQGSAAGLAAVTILPRHVLGGPDQTPPSEVLRAGLVGCGGQGGEDLNSYIKRGGLKVKMWSGKVRYAPEAIPASLDWDMYCGPAPLRPYIRHRTGGTHRGYWDYEGGGMADMGQHHFDR